MAKRALKKTRLRRGSGLQEKFRKKRKRIKKIKKFSAKEKVFNFRPRKIKMKVVGIGGGAGNIVSEIASRIERAKFLAANTDLQALKKMARRVERFQFGQNLTQGLGTGMNFELGEKAALKDLEKIKKIFRGQDFTIFVSCLGGGTGSGSTPIFAKVAKDLKNYTLGIFTLPFLFEGRKRQEVALQSLEKIRPNLNAIIIVPNERVFQIIDQKTPIKEAFSAINKILAENLGSLIEMLNLPGLINIDFADLKTILAGRGKLAFLNTVFCQGENRAEEAAKKILENPLYGYGISGAERILFNISGPKDLAMTDVEKISKTISNFNKKAKIIFGISQAEKLKDTLKITLMAVGCQPKLEIILPKKKIKVIARLGKKIKKKRKITQKKKVEKAKPEKLLPEVKEEKIEIKTRRNALDLRKELEKAEKELLEKESQWEVPAFLRRKAKQ